jgi:hypothetical protein
MVLHHPYEYKLRIRSCASGMILNRIEDLLPVGQPSPVSTPADEGWSEPQLQKSVCAVWEIDCNHHYREGWWTSYVLHLDGTKAIHRGRSYNEIDVDFPFKILRMPHSNHPQFHGRDPPYVNRIDASFCSTCVARSYHLPSGSAGHPHYVVVNTWCSIRPSGRVRLVSEPEWWSVILVVKTWSREPR